MPMVVLTPRSVVVPIKTLAVAVVICSSDQVAKAPLLAAECSNEVRSLALSLQEVVAAKLKLHKLLRQVYQYLCDCTSRISEHPKLIIPNQRSDLD